MGHAPREMSDLTLSHCTSSRTVSSGGCLPSGCAHWVDFTGGNCVHLLIGESGAVVRPSAHKCCFSPLASYAGASMLRIPDSEVWRVLTSTDVGDATQGEKFRITQCYPSVVRSISRHFAVGFFSLVRVVC